MIYFCCSKGDDLLSYPRQSEVARRLLSYGLRQEYGITDSCILKSPLGKPKLKGADQIRISISHCQGAVAVILSDHEVGIDVERIRPYEKEAARRILTFEEKVLLEKENRNQEILFFRYLTLKESYIKALGAGLTYPMKSICFQLEENCIRSNKPWADFHSILNCEEFIISVCCLHVKEQEKAQMKIRNFMIP